MFKNIGKGINRDFKKFERDVKKTGRGISDTANQIGSGFETVGSAFSSGYRQIEDFSEDVLGSTGSFFQSAGGFLGDVFGGLLNLLNPQNAFGYVGDLFGIVGTIIKVAVVGGTLYVVYRVGSKTYTATKKLDSAVSTAIETKNLELQKEKERKS